MRTSKPMKLPTSLPIGDARAIEARHMSPFNDQVVEHHCQLARNSVRTIAPEVPPGPVSIDRALLHLQACVFYIRGKYGTYLRHCELHKLHMSGVPAGVLPAWEEAKREVRVYFSDSFQHKPNR